MLIMASHEIHFLKAESYEMGYGVAKNEAKAEEDFKKSVSQSITLYYYYDSVSTGENEMCIRDSIYGLTKGQYSPTSPRGFVSKSSCLLYTSRCV